MRTKVIIILFFILCSCKSNNNSFIEIDPMDFHEEDIFLSKIADDISYIKLDNKYLLGLINDYKIVNKKIYLQAKDIGILIYDRNGEFLKKIGSIGRGPGEYASGVPFTVDETTGTIYVKDRGDIIKVYSNCGAFIRSFLLPKCSDGFSFSEIEFYNSHLFVAQYFNMGHAEYNWIVTDTLGNIITEKRNPIASFPSREGTGGGVFKFKQNIYYWNWYNDTVYAISQDYNYTPGILFAKGNHRMPQFKIEFNSVDEYVAKRYQYWEPKLLFETGQFIIYRCYFKKPMIALIDKSDKRTSIAYYESEYGSNGWNYTGGIINDIDGGLMFQPEYYFNEDDREFICNLSNSNDIKSRVSSSDFKNSLPLFPEKKKEFEKLAIKLNETDNPVLMVMRLKE